MQLRGRLRRRGAAVARRAEGAHVPPTGGIVAAPTTSLPELIGGRSQLGLPLLLAARRHVHALRVDERRATSTRRGRGATGCCEPSPAIPQRRRSSTASAGERRMMERELDWLPGYAGSAPGAHRQRRARAVPARRLRRGDGCAAPGPSRTASPADDHAWSLQRAIMDFLEGAWEQPDEGIWEVRGPRRHFTHSKVLAWVGVRPRRRGGRAVRPARPGRPLAEAPRRRSTEEVCREAFNAELNSFTQAYGSDELDASTLLIPLLGFLPAERSTRARNDRRDPARPDARRVRRALPARRRRTMSTGCPAVRACSCPARSGSSTRC